MGVMDFASLEMGGEPTAPQTAAWRVGMPLAILASSVFTNGLELPRLLLGLFGGSGGFAVYWFLSKLHGESTDQK